MISNIEWLSDWYKNNCDGDWEHSYGVKIETLDNPGWSITIELENSTHSHLEDFEYRLFKIAEDDWYGYKISASVFVASGDPSKLDFIIGIFREIVEKTKG